MHVDETIEAHENIGRLRRSLGRSFQSLKIRNFRLYFTGQIVSNTGNWLTNVALTLLVLDITHSGTAVGFLAACQYGPILLFSAYGGVIADRHDKRGLLLVTQSLEMLQSVGLAVAAFLPHTPLPVLYALALSGGVFLAFDNALRRSFVREMVGKEHLPNAVLLNSTIVNLSRVVGPALAGALVISVGFGWCFALDAASYLAVLICLSRMRDSELERGERQRAQRGQIREGIMYVYRRPALFINFIMLAIVGILTYNFPVTLPLFVQDSLHQSTSAYTLLYAVMGLGSVVAALTLAQRERVHLRDVISGAAALGLSMLALTLAPSLTVAVPIMFVIGVASIMYTAATTTHVQLSTDSSIQGRVLALQFILLVGFAPIGGPLLGFLADTFGGRVPLLLGGVASLAAAGVGAFASRKLSVAE